MSTISTESVQIERPTRTKQEQRDESELNPADKQSKHDLFEKNERGESDFSSDSDSSCSESDLSASNSESENDDVIVIKSSKNITMGEGNRSEVESESSQSEEEKEIVTARRQSRSVSFSEDAPIIRLDSTDDVQSLNSSEEDVSLSRPPSSQFDSAPSSPVQSHSSIYSSPVHSHSSKPLPIHPENTKASDVQSVEHVDTGACVDTEKTVDKKQTVEASRSVDSQTVAVDKSELSAAQQQIKQQEEMIRILRARISELEDMKEDKSSSEKTRNWSYQIKKVERPSAPEPVNRAQTSSSSNVEEAEEPYRRKSMEERMEKFKNTPEGVMTSIERPLDAPVDVNEKKNFWKSASESSKTVQTSVARPLEPEAASTVDVEEKKSFWKSASQTEKEVVTSVPRPLDCPVDVKEKRKSFHEAAQSNFAPIREAIKEAVEVSEKKAFWTKAAESEKEVVTSVARPLDCPVDVKEKRKSFHEAAQTNFTPVRSAITDVADVNEKKSFWSKTAEAEKEVVTSVARPLDCPVDLKSKMSDYNKTTEGEKEVVTSVARPLDCTVDIKSKMSEYNDAIKIEDTQRETSSKGSLRMKTEKENCDICTKTLYITEKIVADNKNYHKSCFKCSHCNSVLKLGNYAGLDGKFFCKPHFKQLFASKGNYNEGFGNEKISSKWTNRV